MPQLIRKPSKTSILLCPRCGNELLYTETRIFYLYKCMYCNYELDYSKPKEIWENGSIIMELLPKSKNV